MTAGSGKMGNRMTFQWSCHTASTLSTRPSLSTNIGWGFVLSFGRRVRVPRAARAANNMSFSIFFSSAEVICE